MTGFLAASIGEVSGSVAAVCGLYVHFPYALQLRDEGFWFHCFLQLAAFHLMS